MKRYSVLFCALGVASFCATPSWSQSNQKLRIAAYGGIWAESVKKNFVPCFENKTGMKIEFVVGESSDWLNRLRANIANPPMDVVALAEADSFRAGREGLLDQATVEKVPNLADVPAQFHKPWNDYSVAQNMGAFGILYNKSAIADPPKTWREFFDNVAAGKYGKRVSLPAATYTWGPEFLWLVGQQYGGDMDTAFAKLKDASKYIVKYWNTPVEVSNLIGTKEVDAVVAWDGRAINFIEQGNNWAGFTIPGPKTITGLAMLSKTKNGSPAAWDYINCALDPENQLKHAQTILYAVPNSKVVYPDDLKSKLAPPDKIMVPPYDQIFDKFGGWVERWKKEVTE